MAAIDAEHDAVYWGTAYSRDAEPRRLLRVADLVKAYIKPKTPLRKAANNVVQLLALRVASAPLEWYLLERGNHARHLSEDSLWQVQLLRRFDPVLGQHVVHHPHT